MSVLQQKLRREIWHLRGQVLAIALVIAGGVAVCLLSVANYSSLQATRAQYYAEYAFADVFVDLTRAPNHLEERIAAIPGITRLTTRVQGAAKLRMPGVGSPVSARLISVPEQGQPEVNRLYLRKGRLPDARRINEVAVIGSFAEAHDLQLGDRLHAIINGREQTLSVVGIVESPEFIYVIPPGAMLPDYKAYGVLWLSRPTLGAAMDREGAFNSIVARVSPSMPVADVITRLDRLLAPYGGTGAYARKDQFSHRFLSDELEQLKTMATVFPAIFMSVAMFLLHVVISRLITTQRDVIAILKAFGYTNRQVGWHYSQLVLLISAIGLVLGLVLGLWLGRAMSELYLQYYRFPELLFRVPLVAILAITATTLLVAWLGAWQAIRRAVKLPPAEAMRPEAPVRFQVSWLERVLSAIRWSPPARIILRQLLRRPLRGLFSVVGIGFATAIVVVGNFQFDAVSLMVHAQFARVQQQDLSITLVDPVNENVLHGLVREPGILYAEGTRSVAVKLVHGHRSERSSITGLTEGARLQFVIDEAMEPVRLPADGLLLTDFLADKLGVRPGQSLQVEVLEGKRQSLTIPVAGVTSEFLGVGAYMRRDALNRYLREGRVINQAQLNIDDARAQRVYNSLRDKPQVMAVNDRQAMLDSFYETLANTFLTFTFFNGILGAVIAFGVIYNTVRISLAERGRELASLRVLGYTRGEVGHILLGEVALLLCLGIPLGWLLGQGMAWALVTAMQTELYRVPLIITPQTLAIAATIVIVSALLSGMMAWWRLRNLDLVAVLKTRE
ncbi:FtsX-like permease family protein [Marinobacteraceae bacterium S3BR75-40.1]